MGTTLPHSLCRLMQELGPPVCLLHATVKPGLQIQTGYMVHGLMNSKGLGACVCLSIMNLTGFHIDLTSDNICVWCSQMNAGDVDQFNLQTNTKLQVLVIRID